MVKVGIGEWCVLGKGRVVAHDRGVLDYQVEVHAAGLVLILFYSAP
jgi:hypothetical protein